MPGQYVVSPNVPAWLVVVLGLKVVKVGAKEVSGLKVEMLVGLNVVVVMVLGLNVVVDGRAVEVLVVETSSSVHPTKGSPLLPASQKHSSPLSVTFWQQL